jgi:hypothetical protein
MLDCVLGFRKAFLNEQTGRECRDPKMIAQNYLKTYFIIDLLSGIPFCMISANIELRLLSLIKILRLNRLERIITYLQMDNEARRRIRIFYLAIRIVLICHWVACLFYKMTFDKWNLLSPAE